MKFNFKTGLDLLTPTATVLTSALRDARNVLVDANGGVRTRPAKRTLTADSPLTLYAEPGGKLHYATKTEWNTLEDSGASTSLGPVEAVKVAYITASPAGLLLATDVGYWHYDEVDGLVRLDIPKPAPPTASGSGGGPLPAGTYKVAVSYVDATGREGPLSWSSYAEITGDKGGSVSVAWEGKPGYKTNVYCSYVNGGGYALVGNFPGGSTTVAEPPVGRAPFSGHEEVMPVGQYATIFAGRLLVASGTTLYMSQPYRYGVMDAVTGYVTLPGTISGLAALEGPLFIGTSRGMHRLNSGDFDSAELRRISTAPVVPGSMVLTTGDVLRGIVDTPPLAPVVLWFTADGHIAATAEGGVTPLSPSRISLAVSGTSASAQFSEAGNSYVATFLASPASYAADTVVAKP